MEFVWKLRPLPCPLHMINDPLYMCTRTLNPYIKSTRAHTHTYTNTCRGIRCYNMYNVYSNARLSVREWDPPEWSLHQKYIKDSKKKYRAKVRISKSHWFQLKESTRVSTRLCTLVFSIFISLVSIGSKKYFGKLMEFLDLADDWRFTEKYNGGTIKFL